MIPFDNGIALNAPALVRVAMADGASLKPADAIPPDEPFVDWS